MKSLYPLTFELFNADGFPELQVNFDDQGEIGQIFTRNNVLDCLILADLESFKEYRFECLSVIQARVDHELEVQNVAAAI